MTKKIDVYEMVTQKIIEKLEAGTIPWRMPWNNANAVNWRTQKPYRGINSMLLESGEYATFKQIKDAGGKVKKGQKGQLVVFWKWLEREDEETGKTENIPFLRYYTVFEINKQAEGLESKRISENFEHNPIEDAEKIFENFMDAPTYSFNSGKAYYRPSMDHINVPPMKDFPDINEYYSTLFHEMVHCTGHTSRLNRPGVNRSIVAFGDDVYSREELVAEIGAAMLCGIARIDNHTIENSAAYLQSWLRVLKEDKKLIVQAAAQAQKSADYIQNIKY